MSVKSLLMRSACAALLAPVMLAAAPAQAETRGYIIGWFATATANANFKEACPENRNGVSTDVDLRDLMEVGYSREEAQKIVAGEGARDARSKVRKRAVVNGQNMSIYNYPDAVKDPNIEMVTGPHAYGFDLDGKAGGAEFTDPETKGKVDNQLYRAVGCTESFNATPPVMPYPEELAWQSMTDSAPAWLIQISGADLSKDGPVTITLDRATRHPVRDATGGPLRNATYVVDPSPRSHNVLQGQIKDGVISITPQDIYLEAQMPFYSEIAMQKTQMRMKVDETGKIVGYWGGYIDWTTFVYMFTSRSGNNADTMGIYHAVKKMADADPDPKTGQNRAISTTWRLEAVPAYIADSSGKILAQASSAPVATQAASK